MPIQIFIKTLTGKSVPVEINPEASVGSLKNEVQNISGIPADQQRLIYAGKQLELDEGLTLEAYGIEPLSTIHLVLRLRAGMRQIQAVGSGYTMTVNVHNTDSAEVVRRRVRDKEGLPLDQQRLIVSAEPSTSTSRPRKRQRTHSMDEEQETIQPTFATLQDYAHLIANLPPMGGVPPPVTSNDQPPASPMAMSGDFDIDALLDGYYVDNQHRDTSNPLEQNNPYGSTPAPVSCSDNSLKMASPNPTVPSECPQLPNDQSVDPCHNPSLILPPTNNCADGWSVAFPEPRTQYQNHFSGSSYMPSSSNDTVQEILAHILAEQRRQASEISELHILMKEIKDLVISSNKY